MPESSPHRATRRHPSAGNVSSRPTLVMPGDPPATLPPISFPLGDEPARSSIRFGPGLDHESLVKLISPLEGRRILDLGCGTGSAAVAMAAAGARVTAVDPSNARLSRARERAELAEVHVEFHHSDLADLAFIRADSVDCAVAIYSLAQVQDLPRVFRQVHRVLSTEAAFVVSLPHPFATICDWDPDEQSSPWLAHTAWSNHAQPWRVAGDEGTIQVHQISTVFTSLQRSNFRVDTVLEPRPTGAADSPHRSAMDEWLPPTLIIRGRKQGI